MTEPNDDFDQILSTTLANHRKQFTDNIFEATPLVDRLRRADNIRMIDGGESIVEPLMYGKNETVKPYGAWERLDLTPQTGFSAAKFEWRRLAAGISIDGLDEAKNSGDAQLIHLLKSKIKQAEMSYVDAMNTMFYGDGTTYNGDANANAWNGLGNLVATTGTVGGIDSTTYTWWKPTIYTADTDGGGADTGAFNSKDWARAYLTASKGTDKPTFALTTQDIALWYEESLIPNLRFTSNNEADSRFENILFRKIPVFSDLECTTGYTYFLNEKYINLVGHTQRWMKASPFQTVPDIDGRFSTITSYGNLTVSNRKRQAVVTGQIAPA